MAGCRGGEREEPGVSEEVTCGHNVHKLAERKIL